MTTDPLTPVLSDTWDAERSWTLETYTDAGGYRGLANALAMTPDQVIEAVKDSGLRGRGGAGFPTGMKWGFIPKDDAKPHYLVVNADESEPGTCKDIPLMMAAPHTLVEGVIISSYAIRARTAFIYVRGEVLHVLRRMQHAVQEAYLAGHLGTDIHGSGYDLDVIVHAGAGAYICGEETALLDSLEGRRGQPRLRPPFPAIAGLYASPTVINNVESIASVPMILDRGADWFSSMGTEKSKGFNLYSLSGHVERPGQYEAPLGITLRELLEIAGGVRAGHRLKFWTPGGSSTPILTDEHLDVPLDYEGIAAAGSMLGTKALQIFDETTSVVRTTLRWVEFYKHESCGKCTPCREGSWWMVQVLRRLEAGKGTEEDVDLLLDMSDNMAGRSFCALADGTAACVDSAIQYFRDEFVSGMHTPAWEAFPYAASTLHAPIETAGGGPMTVTNTGGRGADVEKRADLVTLTIDDVEISVPKGTLVIRAAELIGVQVPRFCDHPLLDPVGACRQCLVEVPDAGNGRPMPKPQASCTLTVAPGMVVRTQATSPVADKAQQGNMEFLLVNHPLDCPVCDKGGECPLQNQAMSNGRGDTRFLETKRTFPKPINISAQVLLDRERCVLCARCTRFSDQIAGDPFIEMIDRGALQQVGIYEHQPFDSYFSGNTIQICPVGALTSAGYRFRSRPFDLVSTPSVAEHDACGAAIRVDHRRGKVMRRLAGDDPEVNEEWISDKDRFAFTYATQDDRLTHPLVRDDRTGELQPVSWPAAFAAAAAGLAQAAGHVGVLTGGRLTREDSYAYAKFARAVLDTNNIDFRARRHSAEEEAFLAAHVAGSGLGLTYADLEQARTVVLAGLDPEEEAATIFLRLRKAVRKRGQRVFALASHTSRGLSKLSATVLPTVPGAEAAALAALGDDGDVALDGGGVLLVGERLAMTPGAYTAAAALARRTGARLAWVPRRAGDRGAVDAGCLPTLLPGGRTVADPSARADMAAAWGVDALPARLGLDTDAIVQAAAHGRLSALVVAGVDPSDLPDPSLARTCLEAVPFLVSLEVRASEVSRRADVVLPVAPVAEKSGTFVDWEGRPRPFAQVLSGGHALPDVRVLAGIAEAMPGRSRRMGFRTVEHAGAELAELGPWDGVRAEPPAVEPVVPPAPSEGAVVLDTWKLLIDDGRMLDGEPYLRATARPATVRLSAATLHRLGVAEGQQVTLRTDSGAVTLPAETADIPDGVAWTPQHVGAVALRLALGASAGDVVRVDAGVGNSAQGGSA